MYDSSLMRFSALPFLLGSAELLCAWSLLAQSSADSLVEVVAIHTTPEGEHRYLYLRVFSNGTAEWQSRNPKNKEQAATRAGLTKEQFKRIKSVVDDPKLANVEPSYETKYAVVDSWTEWKIKVQRPGQSQVIQVLEFSPGLAKVMKHPYPGALVKLGCALMSTRAEVSGEALSLHGECKKVLQAKN